MNSLFLRFAAWLEAQPWSSDLHSSFYMYNWIESAHVLTLVVSLGLLAVVDLRMLGVCWNDIPASRIAKRLSKPMLLGFTLMFLTGILLYAAIPVRTTQSIWFRFKVILLLAAAINAWLFHRHMNASIGAWDTAPKPPRRTRFAAGLSLGLWASIVICGRFIAYDWFDCGQPGNSVFVNWFAACPVDSGS